MLLEHSGLVRHLSALILLLTVAIPGFAQQIRFGAETPASAPEYGESRTSKTPRVATNGDGYLAVWDAAQTGIFFARVAADGTLLDPVNRFLADGFGSAVVWTGSEYAVFFSRANAVLAVAVSPDGTVTEPKVVHELVGGALEVATTGNTIAVLSQSVLLIVDLDFNLLGQRILRTTLGDFHSADMVAVGNTYVMASAAYQGNTVRTVVINEAGNYPIANAVRVHSEAVDVREVALATDGTNVLVVWSRRESLHAQLIAPDNRLLGGKHTLVNDDGVANTDVIDRPRAFWRGSEYLVTYTTNQFLDTAWAALRVSRQAAAIGTPQPAFGGGTAADVAVKTNGSGAVIWSQNDFSQVRLGLFPATASAPVLDKTVAVAIAAKAQLRVAAERAGDAMVLGWVEQSAAGFEIRIARAGGTPIVVRQAYADWLDVLYDGERLWVVWFDSREQQLWVRRYTPDLEAIDAIPQPFGAPRALNG